MVANLIGLNFFAPIFSFLLVFIVVYSVLEKTKILGGFKFIHILVSFILSTFFIVRVSLVEYIQFNAAWFAVFLVCIFMILALVGFTPGKIDVIMKPGIAWLLLGGLIVFFIISSAKVFSWTLNWALLWGWFDTQWFGLSALLVTAGIVAFVLSKVK